MILAPVVAVVVGSLVMTLVPAGVVRRRRHPF